MIASLGLGIFTFIICKRLKTKPIARSTKKAVSSLQSFFWMRLGTSKNIINNTSKIIRPYSIAISFLTPYLTLLGAVETPAVLSFASTLTCMSTLGNSSRHFPLSSFHSFGYFRCIASPNPKISVPHSF